MKPTASAILNNSRIFDKSKSDMKQSVLESVPHVHEVSFDTERDEENGKHLRSSFGYNH